MSTYADAAPSAPRTSRSLDDLLGEPDARSSEDLTATRRGPEGGDVDPLGRLYQSRDDNSPTALRAAILRCWKMGVLSEPIRVQFALEGTGRLMRKPVALRDAFAAAPLRGEAEAIEAVERCGPYRDAGGRTYIMEFR